jgi:glycosyltransferase involved in cell wall biosynthesis
MVASADVTAIDSGTIVIAAHAWYGDAVGGSFRLATEFARALANEGWQVAYVCCAQDRASETMTRRREQGVDVWRYSCPRSRFGWGRLWAHVRATMSAVRAIHAERPVMALSGHSPLQFLGAALALRGTGVLANYTVHSPFDDELMANAGGESSLPTQIAGWAAKIVDRANIGLADRVQTDSRFTLQLLSEKHGRALARKGLVAPGWVDMERFRPEQDSQRARSRLGNEWPAGVPVFLTVRRLEPRMGLETLIGAAHILGQNGASFRVLIGGGGSLRSRLEGMIRERDLEEHVRLLGPIPEETLPRCYGAADCFVLPTRTLECFGLIVLEAFACQTPVIASRAGAIPELASVQGEAWLFEPSDAHALADRMQRFLSGELRPSIDLRAAALAYDKRRRLARWQRLAIPAAAQRAPQPLEHTPPRPQTTYLTSPTSHRQ